MNRAIIYLGLLVFGLSLTGIIGLDVGLIILAIMAILLYIAAWYFSKK